VNPRIDLFLEYILANEVWLAVEDDLLVAWSSFKQNGNAL
jgi:hypothetical protein